MPLAQVIRSLFVRHDPYLMPLLQAEPTLPAGELVHKVVSAKRLADLDYATLVAFSTHLSIPVPVEGELEDSALVEGIAFLLGRNVGRRIGVAAIRQYRDQRSGQDFLAGPLREAADLYRSNTVRRGGVTGAVNAYIEGVVSEAARLHVEHYSPAVYRVPLRRYEQLIRFGGLQDATDLLRNAHQAVALHRGPADDVILAYLAQVAVFTDAVERLRAREAFDRALQALERSSEFSAVIASARSSTRMRFPFDSKQIGALNEAHRRHGGVAAHPSVSDRVHQESARVVQTASTQATQRATS